MTKLSLQPPPGSPEAIAAGCCCPVIDNGRGRGWMGGARDRNGETLYVINGECEMHGTPRADAWPRVDA